MFREEKEEGRSHTQMTKSPFTSLRDEGQTKLFQDYLRLIRATQRREVESTTVHLYEAGIVLKSTGKNLQCCWKGTLHFWATYCHGQAAKCK